MKLGKSQRDRDMTEVASVAAFDKEGKLLFGFRSDSQAWTLPGGHLEPGESPSRAAVRELYEEAGLVALSLEYLGEEVINAEKPVRVHAYKATVEGEPTGKLDPDQECEHWFFVPVEDGVPEEILNNLHSPKNVTLKLLGLQNWAPDPMAKRALDEIQYLQKVSLTSEDIADRMTPHTLSLYEGIKNIHTYALPQTVSIFGKDKPLYHHVATKHWDDKWGTEPNYVAKLHSISTSPDPFNDNAVLSSASAGAVPVSWLKEENASVPWDNGHALKIGEVATRRGMQNKGLGLLLYQRMLAHESRIVSDTSVSAGADKVWQKLHTTPGVRGGRGEGLKNPHWAEATKADELKPTTMDMDGKSYSMLNKSELQKMAIKDIPVGQEIPKRPGEKRSYIKHDYSHLLSPLMRRDHDLNVEHDPEDGKLDVYLYHRWTDRYPGMVSGEVRNGNALHINTSNLEPHLRGKGIGTSMYEALMSHAHNVLGAKIVHGMDHSTMAAAVHQKIANKHGLNYFAKPSKPYAMDALKTKSGKEYDSNFGDYSYVLKSEQDAEDEPIIELEMTPKELWSHEFHRGRK